MRPITWGTAVALLGALAAAAPARGDKPGAADKKPVYDEKADAGAQIDAALAAAKKDNRRVLIQWGGNWCPWCVVLHRRFTTDPALVAALRDGYELVPVDVGHFDKHMELAKKYGADLKKNGVPYLTVLEADGKVVANEPTDPYETKGPAGEKGHDSKKLLAFLREHQARR
jgi:thiol:disulfide interchange protein